MIHENQRPDAVIRGRQATGRRSPWKYKVFNAGARRVLSVRYMNRIKFLQCCLLTVLLFSVSSLRARAQNQPDSEKSEKVTIESADYLKTDRDSKITTLRGNVSFTYQDNHVTAEEVTLDEGGKNAVAKGNVILSGPDGEFTGQSLFYDYDKEWFELAHGAGSTTSANISGRAYFTGERIYGDRHKIKIYKMQFTTCGPGCTREYHMRAKDATIFPGIKIIARHVYFHIGGSRVLYFPVYILSLKNENHYMPVFGYNKDEGFYVYTKYPYLVRAAATGWVLLDVMTVKGIRYGAEHEYVSKRFGGAGYNLFKTNKEKDTGSSTNIVNVKQAFKFGDKTSGNLNFSRNSTFNRYVLGSRVNTNSLSFTTTRSVSQVNGSPSGPQAGKQRRSTTLAYSRDTSQTYSRTTRSDNIAINRNINHSDRLVTAYSYNIGTQQYSNRPTNSDGRFKLDTTYSGQKTRLTLSLQRTYDLDGYGNTSDSAESLNVLWPRLSLSLQPALYQKLIPERWLPISVAQFSNERIRQGPRNKSTALRRNTLLLGASKQLFKNVSWLQFKVDQKYTQYIYSTKDAEYIMAHTTDATYLITQASKFNLNFSSQKTSGGSPYRYNTQSESIRLKSTYSITKPKTGFSLNTQYNYRGAAGYRYSPLTYSYSRATSQNSRLTVGGSRNINNDTWNDTTTAMEIGRKNTILKIGALWNTEELDLRKTTIGFQSKRSNGWKITSSAVFEKNSNYSPIRNITAVKTNCCTEIETSYNTVTDEFQFHYVILAFPTKKFGFMKSDSGLEIDQSVFQDQQTGQTGQTEDLSQ
jgi:hypothetical protein